MQYYALAFGFFVWMVVSYMSGRVEAWDSHLYWKFGYPALVIGSALMGYHKRGRAWRWGLWAGMGQALGLLLSRIMIGGGFSLAPMGFLVILLLTLPCMLFSMIGGKLGRR